VLPQMGVMSDRHAEQVPQSARQNSRIHFGILEDQKQQKRPVKSTLDRGFGLETRLRASKVGKPAAAV
jgi:hypothetical protein